MPIIKASVGTTATLVQGSIDREWFILQNLSDTDIFVSLEGTSAVTGAAGASPGYRLAANGGTLTGGEGEFNLNNNGPIYAIHEGTGSKTLVLQHI